MNNNQINNDQLSNELILENLRNTIEQLQTENKNLKKILKTNKEIISKKEQSIKEIEQSLCLNKYGFIVDEEECLESLPCQHYVKFKTEEKLMNSVRIRDIFIYYKLPIPNHFNVNDKGRNKNE